MKIIAGVLVSLLLLGCNQKASVEQQLMENETENVFVEGIRVYTDDDTGCQYVSTHGGNSIYPRLGKDGKQMCREAKL